MELQWRFALPFYRSYLIQVDINKVEHIPEISEIRFEIARCVCRFFLYILKLERVERHCDISKNIVRFDMKINEKYIVIRRAIYYEVSEALIISVWFS